MKIPNSKSCHWALRKYWSSSNKPIRAQSPQRILPGTMDGPRRKFYKLCCHLRVAASSNPWSSTRSPESTTRTPRLRSVPRRPTSVRNHWTHFTMFSFRKSQVVKQMPTIASNKQPTIAVITAQYCEKLAVDAMLENKETFVRYTTVGKCELDANRTGAEREYRNSNR